VHDVPRRAKNTATGSQAAPVGSMITSKTVLAGMPASAACSMRSRLSRVGRQRRRVRIAVVSSITTTVWLLVTPRSIPTMRRVVMVVSSLIVGHPDDPGPRRPRPHGFT
jgi:hypothetical protein